MRVVLVDSPGPGPGPHWSSAFADEVEAGLEAAGVACHRLRRRAPRQLALRRVMASYTDAAVEVALTAALRGEFVDVVVHVGFGGRGSPNLTWLAQRLGSDAVAVVRTAEIVCHRGDLVDRRGAACGEFERPERCAACCRTRWRAPSVADLESRLDLLAAGLQACSVVWLADDDDGDRLERIGVPRRALRRASSVDFAGAVVRGLAASGSPAERRDGVGRVRPER